MTISLKKGFNKFRKTKIKVINFDDISFQIKNSYS